MCYEMARISVTESVHHYLFDCQMYTDERHVMDRRMNRKSRDVKYLLSTKGLMAVAEFMVATRRFTR